LNGWFEAIVLLSVALIAFLSREIFEFFFRRTEIVDIQLNEHRGQAVFLNVLFRSRSRFATVLKGAVFQFHHSENLSFKTYPAGYMTIELDSQIRISEKTRSEFLPLQVSIEPNGTSRVRIQIMSAGCFFTVFSVKFLLNQHQHLQSQKIAACYFPADSEMKAVAMSDKGYSQLSTVSLRTKSANDLFTRTQAVKNGSISPTWIG